MAPDRVLSNDADSKKRKCKSIYYYETMLNGGLAVMSQKHSTELTIHANRRVKNKVSVGSLVSTLQASYFRSIVIERMEQCWLYSLQIRSTASFQ